MAQRVESPPAVLKTWVWSLIWEDPKWAWQPTPVFLPGESPWTDEPGGVPTVWTPTVHGVTESQKQPSNSATKRSTAQLWLLHHILNILNVTGLYTLNASFYDIGILLQLVLASATHILKWILPQLGKEINLVNSSLTFDGKPLPTLIQYEWPFLTLRETYLSLFKYQSHRDLS